MKSKLTTQILPAVLLLTTLAACDNLGYEPEPELIEFNGVSQAIKSYDGGYIVTWDRPANDSVEIAAYEVWLGKVNDFDLYFSQASAALQGTGEESEPEDENPGTNGDVESNVVTDLPPEQYTGQVVARLKDQTSYNLGKLLPGKYGIRVTAVGKDGRPDQNLRVLMLEVAEGLKFSGLKEIVVANREAKFIWNQYTSDIEGGSPIRYQLFEGPDGSEFVFNNPIKEITDPEATSITKSLAEKKPGSVWYYGVRVRNPLRQWDDNTSVLKLVVPENDTYYAGCSDGVVLGPTKAQIFFDFMTFADNEVAEKVNVYRNSQLVFTSTSASETKFIDVGLLQGETYEYKCESIYKGVAYMGEERQTLTTYSTDAPTFAGIKSAATVAGEPRHVTATWGVATGVPAQYFKVYGNPGNTIDWSAEPLKSVDSTNLSTTIIDLGDDLTYSFGVRACSGNDDCDANTQTITLTTPDNGAPLSPGATTVRMDGGSMVVTAPWQHSYGGIVKRLVYLYSGNGDPSDFSNYTGSPKTFIVSNVNAPETELVIPETDLDENTTYHVIVRDEDLHVIAPASHGQRNQNTNYVTIDTGDLSAPNFISGITSLNLGEEGQRETTLKAGFTPIDSDPPNPAGASHYQVYTKVGGGNACADGTLKTEFSAAAYTSGVGTEYTITGLSPRTLYSVCLKARDNAGNISNTGSYLVRSTIDETDPLFDGLQGLVYEVETASLVASWNASPSSDILEYRVKVWKNVAEPAPSQILTITKSHDDFATGFKLDKNTFDFGSNDQVYMVVDACDNAGFIPGGAQNCTSFPLSSHRDVTMADIDPPLGFVGIGSEAEQLTPDDNTITVSWFSPADVDPEVDEWEDYAGFKIYFVNQDLSLDERATCTCPTNGCTISNPYLSCDLTGLDPYRTYNLHVRAFDASGNLTILDPLARSTTKRTSDTVPPVFNASLSSQFADGSTAIEWNPATDNQYADEPGAVISYEVWRKVGSTFADPFDPGADGQLLTTVTDEVHSDNQGYVSGETYYYTVCAKDASENRTCAGSVRLTTTPDLIPPVISSFTHDKDPEDKSWKLTWTMSDNKAGPLIVKLRRAYSETKGAPVSEIDPTVFSGTDVTTTPTLGGPQNQDTWVNYLLTVEDGAGNTAQANLSLFSQNLIEITGIKSDEGPLLGGKYVILEGRGFHSSTTVTIGGANCTGGTYLTNDLFLCKTTAHAEGLADVTATNSDGSFYMLSEAYSYCSEANCANICNKPSSWYQDHPQFAAGDGNTESTALLVCDGTQLDALRNHAHGKYVALGDNIDLSAFTNNSFQPLTTHTNGHFYAHMNGNGYAVANFTYIAPPLESYAALISQIPGGYNVTNINIVNSHVEGEHYVGLLVGYAANGAASDVSHIVAHGTVVGAGDHIGLIVGRSYSRMINVRANGHVTGGRYVGLIAGYKNYTLAGASSAGTVVAIGREGNNGCYAGGLVGHFASSVQTLTGAYSTADVFCDESARAGSEDLYYAGGLFGTAGGNLSLSDCYSTGNVTGARIVGGLVGSGGNNITGCYTTGDVTALRSGSAGGLVGSFSSSSSATIADSYATGVVSSGGGTAGGLTGYANGITIQNSYYDGVVAGGGESIGGLIGYQEHSYSAVIEDSYSKGSVSGTQYVGGLVGRNRRHLVIRRSYSTAHVTGTGNQIGGLIGYGDYYGTKLIEDSYATGTVTGADEVGGICGRCRLIEAGSLIQRTYATGDVSGDSFVGGFAGRLYGRYDDGVYSVQQSYATGDVTGARSQIGGFIGRLESNSKVTQSYATGNVTGGDSVGGFLGYIWHQYVLVDQSFATGNVSGDSYNGGFIGNNSSRYDFVRIENCYAQGNVTGTDYIGGFAGTTYDTIQNSYAVGRVSRKIEGLGYVGGFTAGYSTYNAQGHLAGLPEVFWDLETTEQTSSGGSQGSGLPTTGMKSQASFSSWDFGTVWMMSDNDYPKLQWQP